MKQKLKNNNSDELIIFLSGWGCDNNQFENMHSTRDVLICWDYSDLNLKFDFKKYKNIYLIAYSAGVVTAGLIEERLPDLKMKIAINGNPLFLDEYFGISKNILKVFRGLNINNYMDFRRNYLVIDEKELKEFNETSSKRSFDNCFKELDKLEEYSLNNNKIMNFDYAIISDKDKIFITERQMEFYRGKYKILKNSAHNVFSHFKGFDEIIDFCEI